MGFRLSRHWRAGSKRLAASNPCIDRLEAKISTQDAQKPEKVKTVADWKYSQNASQFARLGYEIAGTLGAEMLVRTADSDAVVNAVTGSVRCLEAKISGRIGFVVSVAGSVGLTCQSCGAEFDLPVDSRSVIHVAQDAAELASWEDEAFECIEANEKTSALELVEDELLLSIPYVPRCQKCDAADAPRTHEFN